MQKFKPLEIESILDQIDRGSPLDLGSVQWDGTQERYVANQRKQAVITSKSATAPLPTMDSIMTGINKKSMHR